MKRTSSFFHPCLYINTVKGRRGPRRQKCQGLGKSDPSPGDAGMVHLVPRFPASSVQRGQLWLGPCQAKFAKGARTGLGLQELSSTSR